MGKRWTSGLRDPRLLIGVVLVAGSVAGVLSLVGAVSRTEPVYAASGPILPGERITEAGLTIVQLRLDPDAALYLTPGELPSEGLVATRPVLAGELVPVSAVGSLGGLRLASVVVAVTGGLPAAIAPGTPVDVWSTVELAQREWGPPSVLVGGATVVRVVESGGLVATRSALEVELLVPRSSVARVLAAVAAGDAISLVPVGIPTGG